MRMFVRLAPSLALLVCGCGKVADQPAGNAGGAQVLPGTISDAMINLDQSQAQPLLQPPPVAKAGAAAAPSEDASDPAPAN